MRATPNRCYLILLVALFVLCGGQTVWAAAPTISSNPDPILPPVEDEVGYSVVFTAADADGDLESFDVINKPKFLVQEKNTQSEIELFTTTDTRPLAEHVGQTFTFSLSASDKDGAITNQDYSITVQEFNDPPVIQETIVSDEATQGEVYNFEFTVTDEEGHQLSWNPDAVDTQLPWWLDVVGDEDEYGAFAITSTTEVTNDIALEASPVQIRIQIDDDPQDPDLDVKSDTLEYLLNLVNVNDAPEIDEEDNISSDDATEGQPYEHRFTVTDDDGDALTVVRPIPEKPEWITVAASTDAADPPNTWVISGVPSNDDALSTDPHEIDILIKDENEATARLQYTITVKNLNDTPEQTSGFNAPEFATQDEDFIHKFNVEDIDLDEVVWNQTNSEYPSSWMDVDVTFLEQENEYQFTLSGTPSNADVLPDGGAQKTETVIIAFNDDANISDSNTEEEPSENTFQFDITYVNVNDAPTIPPTATFPDSIKQDETYEYSFTVTDIDGNDLRVVDSGMQLPAWAEPMTIEPAAGGPSGTEFTISGTPNFEDANQSDPYPVVIKIGDGVQGDEKFFSHEFTISVVNVNDGPEVILEPVQDPDLDTLAIQNALYSKPIGFSDKDDDTINWVEGDSIFPPGMEVQATGSKDFEIRWIPTNDQVTHIVLADGTLKPVNEDPYNVSLKFCDDFEGDPKCATVTITGLRVQNVNDAPTIRGSIPALVAGEYTETSPFTFIPEVGDADELFGDVNFQYTITGQNAISDWSVFSLSNGQLNLFPGASEAENSPYNISISVSDGEDKTPLPLEVIVLPEGTVIESGDFNLDGSTDLSDAILLLKVLVGIDLPQDQTFKVQTETDPNTDDQAGLQDVIFILDHVATP